MRVVDLEQQGLVGLDDQRSVGHGAPKRLATVHCRKHPRPGALFRSDSAPADVHPDLHPVSTRRSIRRDAGNRTRLLVMNITDYLLDIALIAIVFRQSARAASAGTWSLLPLGICAFVGATTCAASRRPATTSR